MGKAIRFIFVDLWVKLFLWLVLFPIMLLFKIIQYAVRAGTRRSDPEKQSD